MSFTNLLTLALYTGDAANVTFAIPFYFIPGEAALVTKVYLIDNPGLATEIRTLQTITTHYSLDPSGDNPTNVIMVTAPTAIQKLEVKRISVRTQANDLDSGGPNTPYNPLTVENELDRQVMIAQELDVEIAIVEALTGGSVTVSGVIVPDWVTATVYVLNQVVIDAPTGRMYRALTAHTSSGDFNTDLVAGDWELVLNTGDTGDTGVKGDKGDTGSTGSSGSAGSTGPAGTPGVISAIASQAEAEAGTNNTKGMTPLRSLQALEALVGSTAYIVALQAQVTTNIANINVLSSRLSAIEGSFQITHAVGEQRLLNNATNINMIGTDSADDGRGSRCELNPVGAKSAELVIELYREDDGEVRFTRHFLELHYISGTWYLSPKDVLVLIGNASGVSFAVTQDGSNVALINYISDSMSGGNYTTTSKIRWQIRELPATSV